MMFRLKLKTRAVMLLLLYITMCFFYCFDGTKLGTLLLITSNK